MAHQLKNPENAYSSSLFGVSFCVFCLQLVGRKRSIYDQKGRKKSYKSALILRHFHCHFHFVVIRRHIDSKKHTKVGHAYIGKLEKSKKLNRTKKRLKNYKLKRTEKSTSWCVSFIFIPFSKMLYKLFFQSFILNTIPD